VQHHGRHVEALWPLGTLTIFTSRRSSKGRTACDRRPGRLRQKQTPIKTADLADRGEFSAPNADSGASTPLSSSVAAEYADFRVQSVRVQFRPPLPVRERSRAPAASGTDNRIASHPSNAS